MKKLPFLLVIVGLALTACARSAAPEPTLPAQDIPTQTLVVRKPTLTPLQPSTPTIEVTQASTATATLKPTEEYPLAGRGPTNFAAGIDPLTGLQVADPALLERRPIVIKVENLPREHRPQWGLSFADLVYEYYTEQGTTRFAAIFYGKDAEIVAPIRSGRFFDTNVVQMYKGVFVYGSAYEEVRKRFAQSDFADRLILETPDSCPAVCRYNPQGENLLAANTHALQDYLKLRQVNNDRPNLDGMFFQRTVPAGGETADNLYVRYSGAIYNRWDYDAASGRYTRFAETQNDVTRTNEVYAQLTDRSTGDAIAADTVVMLCAPHSDFVRREDTEVIEISLDPSAAPYVACDGKTYPGGRGPAFAARDGKLYPVFWKRASSNAVLTLVNADDTPFPFKPGQTWFEVLGAYSQIKQDGTNWHFVHVMRAE